MHSKFREIFDSSMRFTFFFKYFYIYIRDSRYTYSSKNLAFHSLPSYIAFQIFLIPSFFSPDQRIEQIDFLDRWDLWDDNYTSLLLITFRARITIKTINIICERACWLKRSRGGNGGVHLFLAVDRRQSR